MWLESNGSTAIRGFFSWARALRPVAAMASARAATPTIQLCGLRFMATLPPDSFSWSCYKPEVHLVRRGRGELELSAPDRKARERARQRLAIPLEVHVEPRDPRSVLPFPDFRHAADVLLHRGDQIVHQLLRQTGDREGDHPRPRGLLRPLLHDLRDEIVGDHR